MKKGAQSLEGWEPFSFVLKENLRPLIPISNFTYVFLERQQNQKDLEGGIPLNKKFFPFPALETQRLVLRQIEEEHANALYEILSDEEVAKFEYFYAIQSVEKAIEFIRRYKSELEEGEEVTWGIFLKENNALIGTCCLGNFSESALRAEIGYTLLRSEWGKGYATEAAGEVIKFGFEVMGLNRIEATITPGNDASVQVLKKLNFMQEGVVRERDLIKGKLEDGIIMAILSREFMRS